MTDGSTQEESPECMPASSMCSMMPPMTTVSPSAKRVHVHFGGVFEELVDQHGRAGPMSAACAAHVLHRLQS